MTTNGHTAQPSREDIIRVATYYTAVYAWYDTSTASQQRGDLTISVADMQSIQPLQPGDTHQFYVMINDTGITAYLNKLKRGKFGYT